MHILVCTPESEANMCIYLYRFFDQEWAVAVFHDRFHDFLQEVNEIVSSSVRTFRSHRS